MDQQAQAPAVLVVAGTHGNERNAPWLLQHWQHQPAALAAAGLPLELVIGNPAALAANLRYLDRDLNRCFQPALLDDPSVTAREVARARQLLALHGAAGERPCSIVFDLHSTTSAMGNSLVVYGRRPADLALAAAIQARLGLPVYLHEGDARQSGFLLERWPCGLVIEVGPVPQGVVQARICRQTQLALEAGLAALADARQNRLRLPSTLVVHRHLGSLDLPRDGDGAPLACVHPQRQDRDWRPLQTGDPLFVDPEGRSSIDPQTEGAGLPGSGTAVNREEMTGADVVPVFINEAAYGEKGIALSLTRRERLAVQPRWAQELGALAAGLGGPL
jgi:aspartoacylase